MMRDLYPEPPHLSIAVYCDKREVETFTEVCGVAEFRLGAFPSGAVQVAPRDMPFEWTSDLAKVSQEIQTDPERARYLIEGLEIDQRVLKAGYRSKRVGTVVVEYMGAAPGDQHPIGITVSAADSLGIPDFVQTRADRARARKLARWCAEALEGVSTCRQVLYACIGMELPCISPASLGDNERALPTEVFVARRTLDSTPALDREIRRIYPEAFIRQSEAGLFLSGWAPFTPEGKSLPDADGTALTLSGLLAQALRD